ncbi:MAG: hypothetical protein SF182_14250 [Deltaproteobacteria bacterium]|nr:hypothetical protein [Deltaproteobacteria bacterium]
MSSRARGPAARWRSAAGRRRLLLLAAYGLGLVGSAAPVAAQVRPNAFEIIGGNVQERANAVLTLMAFSVVPDLTSSFLSINNGTTGDPEITMTQVGGGFTLSDTVPIWLEGLIGFNRYDPKFVATNGMESREVPVKWNTITGTGGIGWDFRMPFYRELIFRPLFNFSLGHVESDSSLAGRLIESRADQELKFLDDGRLNAYGLGGSAMLAWYHYRDKYELEAELRYTNILLQSFDSSEAVSGSVDAETISFWSRWRQPIGLVALQRPIRAVFELANTTYVGDQAGVLGFNYLTSVGGGIEFDTSAVHLVISRIRFVGRYAFGEGVTGAAFSIAVS